MTLQLHSERYAPTGNIASDGINNQLGRPRLDPLTVLVRESVQNCWDARLPDSDGIDVGFHLFTASPDQREAWRTRVFVETPPGLGIRDRLDAEEPWRVLLIEDRGTYGLGGPTRADVVPEDGVITDFVDFLRNLGSPPDKALGGGTYGFGKAALFAGSAVHTLLAYTRCRVNGALQSRLIGAAVGEQFLIPVGEPGAGRYTGRHWWGRLDGDLADPILDEEADGLAAALGLAPFGPDETGTTLAIVDFCSRRANDDADIYRTPAEAIDHIRGTLLWNFWPKLVPLLDARAPIRFRLQLDGTVQRAPALSDNPAVETMASCLRTVRDKRRGKHSPSDVSMTRIWTGNRREHLGWVALARFVRPRGEASAAPPAAHGAPGDLPVNHVALMRSAELVVRYEAGPLLPSSILGYAGVFVVAPERFPDRSFAASEPPTHDDWVPHGVQDPKARSAVRVGMRRVKDALRAFAQPAESKASEGSARPLGDLSDALGGVLTGLPGTGSRVEVIPERKPPRKPVIEEDDAPPSGTAEDDDDLDDDLHGGDGSGGDESGGDGETGPGAGSSDSDKDGATPPPRPVRVGRPRVKLGEPRLAAIDGISVLRLSVDVKAARNSPATTLTVAPTVIIDGGGKEAAPPAGAAVPSVHRWLAPDGSVTPSEGLELRVPGDQDGQWTLDVRLVEDAEVRVVVTGAAEEPT